MRFAIAGFAGILLLALPVTAMRAEYKFTKIADTAGSFRDVRNATVNSKGTVAFFAVLDGGGQAIVTGDGKSLDVLADTSGEFPAFIEAQSINSSGSVAFGVRAGPGERGALILAGRTSTTLTTIADSTGSSDNLEGIPFISNSGIVVFTAILADGSGRIFSRGIHNGPIEVVAATGDFFSAFDGSPASNSSGSVVFTAQTRGGLKGVYVMDGASLTVIADSSGPLHVFSSPPMINDSGEVVFHACRDDGPCGIFVGNGNEPPRTIVDDTGPIRAAQRPTINNGGVVAFQGNVQGPNGPLSGVFIGPDPVTDKVIQAGEVLFGLPVEGIEFYSGLNDAGQISFTAFFQGGGLAGVFRAQK